MGFISYKAGRGKAKSQIEVVIPFDWQLHEQDLLEPEVAAGATSTPRQR